MNNAQLHNKLDQLLKRVEELGTCIGEIERLSKDQLAAIPVTSSAVHPSKLSKLQKLKTYLWRWESWYATYVWTPVLLFLTLMGGVSAYTSLRYDVSVSPYVALDPQDSLQSHFLVTNQGPFDIFNVSYACKYVPAPSGDGPFIAYIGFVPGTVATLRPHGDFSAYCHLSNPLVGQLKDGTFLDFEVMYTPKFLFWQSRRGANFSCSSVTKPETQFGWKREI